MKIHIGGKWSWITLNKRFKSSEEAKEYVNDNFDKIYKLGLYLCE